MPRSANSGDTIVEVCAVPYRVRDGRIEFCLISPPKSSRWEFPQIRLRAKEAIKAAAVRCAKETAGIGCKCHGPKPLDSFSTKAASKVVTVTAFLLLARSETDSNSDCRSRWCFAEEARARIRRKPMRRLIDLALRRIAGAETAADERK